MSGYQFAHMNTYSLSAPQKSRSAFKNGSGGSEDGNHSLQDIVNEVKRIEGACPHVENPEPPKVIYGMDPQDFVEFVKIQAGEAVNKCGTRFRKLRKDASVAIAGVMSYPIPAAELKADPNRMAEYKSWEVLCEFFLKGEFGENLRSITPHTDETYLHIHFYVAEERTADGRFGVLSVHPGRRAEKIAKDEGRSVGSRREAYKGAMRAFQDRYWMAVSKWMYHDRAGVYRPRMTRLEWKKEPYRAKYLLQLEEELNNARKAVEKRRREVERESAMIEARIMALVDAAALETKKRYEKELVEMVSSYQALNVLYENEKKLRIRVERESVEKDLLIARLRADVGEKGGMSM